MQENNQYLDYAGLEKYNENLKQYIEKGLSTVVQREDVNTNLVTLINGLINDFANTSNLFKHHVVEISPDSNTDDITAIEQYFSSEGIEPQIQDVAIVKRFIWVDSMEITSANAPYYQIWYNIDTRDLEEAQAVLNTKSPLNTYSLKMYIYNGTEWLATFEKISSDDVAFGDYLQEFEGKNLTEVIEILNNKIEDLPPYKLNNLEDGEAENSVQLKGNISTAPYSAAFGYDNKTGHLANRIESFDIAENKIYIDNADLYQYGDLLSMYVDPINQQVSKNYDGFATVLQIDSENNYLLVSTLPADLENLIQYGFHKDSSYIFTPNRDTGVVHIGVASFAEGYQNEAMCIATHTEGLNNKSIGKYSHTENNENIAIGWNAHVEGFQNTGKGQKSHTEGYGNVNNGDTTHVEGRDNKNVAGSQSHVEGRDNTLTSDAQYTHVEGLQNTGSATAAHVEGNGNSVTANTAHAEGYHTVASGQSAHAEGRQTEATNYGAHAEGMGGWASASKIQATALGSHAEGRADGANIIASGQGAHAEGRATNGKNLTASGVASHAEGEGTTASGQAAHAEGLNTTASGIASHASGEGTTAQGRAQTVVGKYNKANTSSLFIVGNGEGSNNRSNAFSVGSNGSIYIQNSTPKATIQMPTYGCDPNNSPRISYIEGTSTSGTILNITESGIELINTNSGVTLYKTWEQLLS